MHSAQSPLVEPLTASEADAFFRYLSDHLSDNGSEHTGYFVPLPQDTSRLPADREQAFRKGLDVPVDEPGWRRAWILREPNGHIIGHVDLRAHPESFAEHRCLLGMGVDRKYRNQGYGAVLVAHARAWAATQSRLEWIDLNVLSSNERAIRLYSRVGFMKTGETPDMFRLDGQSFSYTGMTMRIRGGGHSEV
jgi:RimJ/RimL family protein N-acetyltransferase